MELARAEKLIGSEGQREIFVLDMGTAVRIVDLAKQMITLSGLKAEADIEIKYTGLRPGEKLYEELLIGLKSDKTSHPSIFSAREEIHSQDTLLEVMNDIQMGVEANNVDAVKQALSRVVAGFGSGEESNVVPLRKMPKNKRFMTHKAVNAINFRFFLALNIVNI